MTRCLIGVLVVTELGILAALAGTIEEFNVNQIISASDIIRVIFRFIIW